METDIHLQIYFSILFFILCYSEMFKNYNFRNNYF